MSRGLGSIMFLARPYLRLHLAMYTRKMSSAVFPRDDQEQVVAGPDPDRVLFVGDIGVAGYGVLLPSMAMPAQVAVRRAASTKKGCTWTTVSSFDMTAKKAATSVVGKTPRIDVAVVSLGIPDVLMATPPERWKDHLAAVIANIKAEAGDQCRVVLTGIPPMDRFRPIPLVARNLIRTQIGRLNMATSQMQDVSRNVMWVPFPELTSARVYIRDALSYRAMHALWADAIAPYLDRFPDDGKQESLTTPDGEASARL